MRRTCDALRLNLKEISNDIHEARFSQVNRVAAFIENVHLIVGLLREFVYRQIIIQKFIVPG